MSTTAMPSTRQPLPDPHPAPLWAAVSVDPLDRQSWKRLGATEAGRCLVYRLYDATGSLVYVGITWHPFVRWTEHARHRPWWHEVAYAHLVEADDERHARQLETVAIRTEGPRRNLHQAERR